MKNLLASIFATTVFITGCGPGMLTSRGLSLGVFGYAIKFTGGSQAVSFSHATFSLTNNGAGTGATIEARIKLDSVPTANAYIFQMDNTSSFAPYLVVTPSMQVAATVAGSACTTPSTFTSTTVLQVGVSYHVALIAFNNNAAGSSLYINGLLDPTNGGANPTVGQTCSATTSRIGNSYVLNSYFPGTIDELRVSNTVRYTGASFTPQSTPFTPDVYTQILFHGDNYTDSGFLNANESPGGVTALSYTLLIGASYVVSPFP